MKKRTVNKYRAIQARYQLLYNVERMRFDDCIRRLSEEFFISETTVRRVIVSEISGELVASTLILQG